MKYSIEHQYTTYPFLLSTPRKKTVKCSLLVVHQGLVLIRLGKNEFALEKGEAFWIPFDCLTSITFFPQCVVTQIDFSMRLKSVFPSQSGYVSLAPVTLAIIEKLKIKSANLQDAEKYTTHKRNLLTVVYEEALLLKPKLLFSAFSAQLSEWRAGSDTELNQEQLLVLTLREAKKRVQSGQSRQQIIDDLFSGLNEEFEQLCLLVFGEII